MIELIKLCLYFLGSLGMLSLSITDYFKIKAKKPPFMFKNKVLILVLIICYLAAFVSSFVDIIAFIF